MPPKARNTTTGRFAKAKALEAVENLESASGIGGTIDTSDLLEQLDLASNELEELREQKTAIEAVGSISAYTGKREAECAQARAEKQIEQLQGEISILRKLDANDLLLGEDHELDIKVAKPDLFEGKVETVEPFLAACNLVFQTSTKKYASTRARIYYVLSYCTKGQAEVWREKILKGMSEMLDHVAEVALDKKCNTWEAFLIMFRETWKGKSAQLEAQYKIQNLKQGNLSVEQYITSFKLLQFDTQFDEHALTLFFKKGMKDVIKRRIYDSGNVPRNLSGWMDRAKIIDSAWRESEMDRQGGGWKPPLGKVRYAGEQRKRLPDDEYQKRQKEGLCYKCGNKGHLVKDCFAKGRRIQETPPDKDTSKLETIREETQDFR